MQCNAMVLHSGLKIFNENEKQMPKNLYKVIKKQ